MDNLQIFDDIFKIDFPVDLADQILGRMQALYGAGFDKHYGNMPAHELQTLVCTVLSGLKMQDLKRGIERMNSEKWCPTLPEFRSWCISGGDWWTADQAWARTLNFVNDHSKPITTLAKAAFDEIRLVLDQEGQKAAHFAFRDIYDDYLQRAKNAGRVQEMWKPPTVIAQKTHEETHVGTRPPVHLQDQIQKIYRQGGKA